MVGQYKPTDDGVSKRVSVAINDNDVERIQHNVRKRNEQLDTVKHAVVKRNEQRDAVAQRDSIRVLGRVCVTEPLCVHRRHANRQLFCNGNGQHASVADSDGDIERAQQRVRRAAPPRS